MSASSPRILVLHNRADDESGGSLRAALNTGTAMAGAGASVVFSAPLGPSVRNLRFVRSVESEIDVRLFRSSRPMARLGASVRQMWWLLRNLRRFDAIHIHTVFYAGTIYAALLCRLLGVPYDIWPHGSLGRYDLRKHSRAKAVLGPTIFSPVLRNSRHILCASEREASELVTFGSRVQKCVTHLPVGDIAGSGRPASAWREEFGVPVDAYVVLFLGRVDPKKRLDRLVEALSYLADEGVHLFVAGAPTDAPEVALLHELARTRGVHKAIHFLGWLEGTSRAGSFEASDVFVLPSEDENFGVAVIEALLMRRPVIISDKVYLSDDLDRSGAAIVADCEPEPLAEQIRELRSNPERAAAMAARGREFALEKYSPQAIGEHLLRLARGVD